MASLGSGQLESSFRTANLRERRKGRDTKHPHVSPNALFIDSDGFELLIVLLKSLGVAEGAKVKASASQLFFKGVAVGGKKFFYEIKAIRPGAYVREVEENWHAEKL